MRIKISNLRKKIAKLKQKVKQCEQVIHGEPPPETLYTPSLSSTSLKSIPELTS
jgi:hypothetical protein